MHAFEYEVGDLIAGSYRVLRVFGGVGASGMGVVYLVEQRGAPAPFVLKACQAGSPERTSRFRKEAEIWVRIGSHPNVTKALWVDSLDEQLFVAAEYVSGAETGCGSLKDVPRAGVALRQVIRWSMHFCSGMGHALARGLVAHRDVKPANLLLTAEGDLKIADFGLAKTLPVDPSGATHKDTAAPDATGLTGTPPWMAPEQITGQSPDHRCDIYAFGVVLYQLCSGNEYPYNLRFPVGDRSYLEAHLFGTVRPLAHSFWPIIERCLARSPDDRWQSPAEVAAAVRAVANQVGLPCPPLVPPQPVASEELYAKAQSLSALGKPQEALAAVEQYLCEEPDASWAWTQKGRILMELQRDSEAEEATRRAISIDSSGTAPWNNLGLILQRSNRLEESIRAFEISLECDPLNGGAMMNAAQTLIALGQYDRVASILCTALTLSPRKQILLFNAGNLVGRMIKGRALGPAEQVARAIVAGDPGNSQAWHNLGAIEAARGKPEEAMHCARRALRTDPENPDTHLLLAQLCAASGQGEEALRHVQWLISRRHFLSASLCIKAQVLARDGHYGDAVDCLEYYLEAKPSDDVAWFVLCNIAEAEGDLRRALRAARNCESLLQQQGAPAESSNAEWAGAKVRELQARLD